MTSSRLLSLVSVCLLLAFAGAAAAQPPGLYIDPSFMPHRQRMGFEVQPMGVKLREHLGAPPDRGLLLTDVVDGGPAARAGLMVGDVIVAAGETALRQPVDLIRIVGRAAAGEMIDIRLFRDRKERTVRVEAQGEPTPWVDPDHWVRSGLLDGVRELRRSLEGVERALRSFEQELEQKQATDPQEPTK